MAPVGSRLRDAAVDPQPGDQFAPTNAGVPGLLGDPHGPCVVALQALSPRSGNPPAVAAAEDLIAALPADHPLARAARLQLDRARHQSTDTPPAPEETP